MMVRRRPPQLALAILLVAPGLGGCSPSPSASSSTAEATVHGVVKVKGKLATAGTITFNAANVNRKDVVGVVAQIARDGSYSIRTLVGRNTVSVSTRETVKDPVLQYNQVRRTVVEGDNTCDVDVSPP